MRTGVLAMAILAAAAVSAQDPNVGVKVGVYFPTNSTVSNALGDTWLSYGFSFGTVRKVDGSYFGADTNFVSRNSNGNRLFLGTLSYGLYQPIGGSGGSWTGPVGESQFQPYFAVRGGLTYADYRIGLIDSSGVMINANAEVGVNIGNNLNIAARYDFHTKRSGLDFSGASLVLRYNFVRF